MDTNVCEKFENVWGKFPDKLTSDNEYDFKKENFLEGYCDNYECNTNYGKLNAGFFYLLNQFIGSSGSLYNVENNINVVEYIILWLSYMLNLKSTQDDTITNLNNFYKVNVNKHEKYNSFIDLINNKKELMNISKDKVPKLYNLFKILCEMYTKFDEDTSICTKCSEQANKFDKQYEELYKDYNSTNDSSYNQLLCTLSIDYNKLKSKCSNCSSFPEIEKPKKCVENFKQNPEQAAQRLEQISEDASSSSSITNKLFTVLSIFGAIAFFLGISYKYSLFGFRKRFQKQKLREKLKNIKKRMNQ
ncbi:PIR protein [Plasmodium yoelii]|uniref:PIR protein n=2 Tax=Plasmodium yoelii TaxID=5861 RepID=A0AAE9WNS2_PLAYO|nr:PIR protein [Plasmodium yoelii]WBY57086.1 PIR protein [Plasmodium yoelii yoelii]CDU17786.1 YIR protein [Plasmodium yoelii]VTZ78203.1 PIR protein [Plasmodium yoelii]|eukprot:XP_022812093.1 PIR protein [Plasmodium yoelii]